ncbi:hypothetical protein K458DRAFT_301933 [Lentithecium fluviatile CBS 122367]|uniref:Uncharacterized protein n=1 Tax=Lentithecium fluviatile CBS 122367 TaxID=1168545 RepID=A0A6G1J321_9PLEO|nr:hypothetical protein K458DRAFT_301933 [Lentithecium fluviatile CBS 122367]
MVKSGLALFAGRRKSQGNVIEEVEPKPVADAAPAAEGGSGGFRLMSTTEAEARKREEKRRAQEKAASKFRPFSGFGGAHNKGRNHSFDDESPPSSKRDSKSSNGTQSSRPYNNGQFGSTSTLPSSADTDSNDNIFAIPRPHLANHSSSPNTLTMGVHKKQLPALPKSNTMAYGEPTSPTGFGRVRATTSSSYASTAKPPTLDAEMNFGSTSFDDLFSGLDRKETPDNTHESPGRSLLAGKRTFQAEPIKTDRKLDVEAPLTSWDSRGSAENLIPSPRSPDNDSPPPVPPHKYSKYAPVASHSPVLDDHNGFEQSEAKFVQEPITTRKSVHESSPERNATSQASSSAPSLQTPLSSRSASNNTTPKAVLRGGAGSSQQEHDDDENLFAPPKPKAAPSPKPAAPTPKEVRPPPTIGGKRVMSQAEFRAQQQRQSVEPQDPSSDEEDYEDEEDAVERAQQEAIARRKNQKMDLARASMIRSTTAPTRPDSVTEPFSMGFPSEISMKADEWEDEDIPLGILAQHGFPSTARGRPPTQPANAIPSYFPGPGLPDRPASAGAVSNRQSQAFRPVFARNLPDDPHASSFIGGGLVRPSVRESMGFNRGPASVAGDIMGGVGMPMGYPEPQLSTPSLVDQIHMRDMTKQKYMGGASSKKPPAQGPFTGLLGAQMNGPNPSNPQTRMSMMGGVNGMPGVNGMNPMMNNPGMMGMPMSMPMMGMNQGMNGMAYPMAPNDMLHMQQMQQMQQMIAAQQMQLQQMQAMQGSQAGSDPRMPMVQDPRMSMAQDPRMSMAQDPRMSMAQDPRMSMAQDPRMSMGNFGNNFLNVPGAQRPMSMMQQQRPFSTPSQMGGFQPGPAPLPGYTPSIAPSERSNIGLSARYRPVATHQDAKSSVSNNTTLQTSGGATQSSQSTVKGILKHKPAPVQEEEDEAWGKIAARKTKYGGSGAKKDDGLRELTQGIDRL